jgi:tetratricopeptide (TPR) repeat protein
LIVSDFDDAERDVLDQLAGLFVRALDARERGDIDDAEDLLREIIRREPRLAEPHMELARICLDTDRLADAEPHAREALAHLAAGGPWTEDLPENVVQALAHALLAEVLRRRADEEDLIFGDAAAYKAVVHEARAHFQLAHKLDPSDEYSSYHAFFLGIPAKKQGADADEEGEPIPMLLGGEPGEA